MSATNRLYFPRLTLSALTALPLALIFVSVVLIQQAPTLPRAAGFALLTLSTLSLLPVYREWISPSYIEIANGSATVKWNNWQVTGNIGRIDLPSKNVKQLGIILNQARPRIDPVGPLFLLASFALYPLIRLLLPAWQASLYVISKKQLDSRLGTAGDGTLTLSFPAFIFGKRRVRRVVEYTATGT